MEPENLIKYYICLIFALSVYSCKESTVQKEQPLMNESISDSNYLAKTEFKDSMISSDFYKAFQKRSEFLIDTAAKIGIINSFDVNKSGDILLTDLQGAQVYLLDYSGNLKLRLSPEECNPGFHWSPVKAYFLGNYIYIINAAPWGYKFDAKGKCIGELSNQFLPANILVGLSDTQIFGYYTIEGDLSIKKMDSAGNPVSKFGVFPEEYKNFISRVEGGGLVVDKYLNLYQMNITSPKIYKFNKAGKIIKLFKDYPDKFIKLKKDISNDVVKMMKETADAMKYVSLAQSLFLLNDSTLIMKIKLGIAKYKLLLLTTNFEILCDKPYEMKENLVLAKNNMLYFIKDDILNNGNYLNPKIIIYQLNKNEK